MLAINIIKRFRFRMLTEKIATKSKGKERLLLLSSEHSLSQVVRQYK